MYLCRRKADAGCQTCLAPCGHDNLTQCSSSDTLYMRKRLKVISVRPYYDQYCNRTSDLAGEWALKRRNMP